MSDETIKTLETLKEKLKSDMVDVSPFKDKKQKENEMCVFFVNKGIEHSIAEIDALLKKGQEI